MRVRLRRERQAAANESRELADAVPDIPLQAAPGQMAQDLSVPSPAAPEPPAAADEPGMPALSGPAAAEHEPPPAAPEPHPPEPHVPEPAQPAPKAAPVQRTRLSGLWIAIGCFAVVLLFALIFVLQNSQSVEISYLGAHGHLPLGVAMLLAAVVAVLLVGLAGTARILQLRAAARRNQAHTRHQERQVSR
jgi:uncharacterized integral membrane protein